MTFAKTLISGQWEALPPERVVFGEPSLNIDRGSLFNKMPFIFADILCLDDYEILSLHLSEAAFIHR